MGLLLKEGIDINLIKSAFLAFSIIGFLIVLINICPIFKKRLPNYTLQLAGLIGNTSFLGIPIAIALLPSTTINFTIGFDLGTTLFAWIFGPFFLQEKSGNNKIPITRAMCTGTETTALPVNILITVRRLTGSRQKRRHELRHLRREPERLDRPTAKKARRPVGALGQLRHVGERLLGLRRRPRLEPQPRPQPVRPLLGLVDLGALGRGPPLLDAQREGLELRHGRRVPSLERGGRERRDARRLGRVLELLLRRLRGDAGRGDGVLGAWSRRWRFRATSL